MEDYEDGSDDDVSLISPFLTPRCNLEADLRRHSQSEADSDDEGSSSDEDDPASTQTRPDKVSGIKRKGPSAAGGSAKGKSELVVVKQLVRASHAHLATFSLQRS
jgi:hypothetical protein